MRRGAWIAGATFLLVWVPLTLWKGLAFGRAFRIGHDGRESTGPLVEGVIQIGAVMLAPSLFAALLAFALWAWRDERLARRQHLSPYSPLGDSHP